MVILFYSRLFASSDKISPATERASIFDLPQRVETLKKINSTSTAEDLRQAFLHMQTTWSSVYVSTDL